MQLLPATVLPASRDRIEAECGLRPGGRSSSLNASMASGPVTSWAIATSTSADDGVARADVVSQAPAEQFLSDGSISFPYVRDQRQSCIESRTFERASSPAAA